jgi:Tol biopolymer transport system component
MIIKFIRKEVYTMIAKKFRWMIPLFVSLLVVMACGQISVGVVTPTAANLPGETPADRTGGAPTQDASSPTLEPSPVPEGNPIATTVPEGSFPTMAYVGGDGNLWLLEEGSQTPRQVTSDAISIGGDSPFVEYQSPRISSDGTLLAYRQDAGTPTEGGYDVTTGLWIRNLATGEQQQILDSYSAGYAWKPGTHQLAYGIAADTNYFINRGDPDPALANGIRAIDMDSGETREIVAPERGYTLSGPKWSPDGRFLAFEEVMNMEGSGLFAYYDFVGQGYYFWDEAVGNVSWSPDGSLLTYSRQVYTPVGDERLYVRPRDGSEQLLGPEYEGPAYATRPVFSPAGDQIAYLAFLGGPDAQVATVMVFEVTGGESNSLGQFEGVWELAWTPGGDQVVFDFGPWETRQMMVIDVADGSQTLLGDGREPSLAGQ